MFLAHIIIHAFISEFRRNGKFYERVTAVERKWSREVCGIGGIYVVQKRFMVYAKGKEKM